MNDSLFVYAVSPNPILGYDVILKFRALLINFSAPISIPEAYIIGNLSMLSRLISSSAYEPEV